MIKGFVASAFDLGPHAGHIAMLKQAFEHCNNLIVALHVDPSRERPQKNKPIPSLAERWFQLDACPYVSEIIPYETEAELITLLHLIKPDVRFLGDDYKDKLAYTGHELNIPIVYISRAHGLSSSKLREDVLCAKKIT